MENAFSFGKLQNGEVTGLSVLEVTGIPEAAAQGGDEQESLLRNKQGFLLLLTEVYQQYRELTPGAEAALEVLWLTTPAQGQAYSANIHLFLLLRCIQKNEDAARRQLENLQQLVTSALTMQRYDCAPLPLEGFMAQWRGVDGASVRAVAKAEAVAGLQSPLLQHCYAFDTFAETEADMGRLAGTLIQYPGSAVSFQLMPAALSPEEQNALDQTSFSLDTMLQGVADQALGHVSFSQAGVYAKTYKYYANNKASALFAYNLLVFGSAQATRDIASRLMGQLAGAEGQSAGMRQLPLNPAMVNREKQLQVLPWAVHEQLLEAERLPATAPGQPFAPFRRFPFLLTAAEAGELFRLPMGTGQVSAGLPVNRTARGSKTYADNVIGGSGLALGQLKSSARQVELNIGLEDLTKHMLVVGTPGSGKTTFSVGLLDRLWKEHGIPFLVIEPAKNEYRALVQSIPDLQVFTPGKNHISPFVFNPFVPPENVRLESYKSTLKTAFAAGVTMTSPLDKIFEETINNCYSDFKWLDSYTSADRGQTFNISDFVACFKETYSEIGYTGEAANVGRAGLVRLQSLVNLFDNYHSIPIGDLLRKPTVIELAAVENSEEKSLLIALLLLSVLSYVNSNYVGDGQLKNVILLEEAHVLLDAGGARNPGDADPASIAQGLVKRMLAEARAYGIGLIIADQSPRKVTTDVVALTDIKVGFRLVEAEDKQILAASTNMEEKHVHRLARLKPGDAFVFYGRLEEPEEIKTPNYRLEKGIDITLTDESIRQLSTYWEDKQPLLRPYPQCGQIRLCRQGCNRECRQLAAQLARRFLLREIGTRTNDMERVQRAFPRLRGFVQREKNGEPDYPMLYSCVKVHLLRRMKYELPLRISDLTIENSLKKGQDHG